VYKASTLFTEISDLPLGNVASEGTSSSAKSRSRRPASSNAEFLFDAAAIHISTHQ